MIALLLSTFIAAICAPLVIAWYRRQNWLDHPVEMFHAKKTHSKPIPRGGGLVVYVAVLISCAILLQVDKYLVGILLGGLLLAVVGLLNDIHSPHNKNNGE